MKIQCDVCDKEQANVFCPADEAALCDGCDHSIHHANKLASQHTRFSLRHPSFKEAPLCDICQVLLTAHSSILFLFTNKRNKRLFLCRLVFGYICCLQPFGEIIILSVIMLINHLKTEEQLLK
jgi:hypothetical protein